MTADMRTEFLGPAKTWPAKEEVMLGPIENSVAQWPCPFDVGLTIYQAKRH